MLEFLHYTWIVLTRCRLIVNIDPQTDLLVKKSLHAAYPCAYHVLRKKIGAVSQTFSASEYIVFYIDINLQRFEFCIE